MSLASDPLGQTIVASLGSFTHTGYLAPSGSYTRTADVALPIDKVGTYYVVVKTGGPYEFVYTDNDQRVSGPLAITLTPPPDLVVTNITTPSTAVSASRIDVSWTVKNQGSGDASGTWVDTLVLKQVGGAASISLGSFTYGNFLQAGKFYTRTEQFSLPDNIQGVYQAVVTTNATNSLFEYTNTSNNTTSDDATLTIQLAPHPDLQVESVSAPSTVEAGGTVSLEFTVINQGTVATTTPHWTDRAYLSLDNTISGDDILLGSFDNGSASILATAT